ncbi:MAG: hypothetical protein ACTHLO_15085 [Pseudolabrys sp.]
MSLAWATLALILFLLPGVFFFIGLATYERLSREIIRSGVVSEVAMASAIAILIHTLAMMALSAVGFRLSGFIEPLAEFSKLEPQVFVERLAERLFPAVIYLAGTTAAGFFLGVIVAFFIVCGPLRRLARHKWIYDIANADRRRRYVTAFVMTTIIDESRIIMYRGRVHEIFLGPDGALSYLVLKNCFRYYMTFNEGALITSRQFELFGSRQGARPADVWDRLFIEGKNIANVLFDSSPEIREQAEGRDALDVAFREALTRQAQQRAAGAGA